MERLTIDTKILFCDIAQCREMPGGRFCENGYCDQRRVYERLREYERIGLAPEEIMVKDDVLMCAAIVLGTSIDHIRDLLAAEKEGRVAALPCKAGERVSINNRSYLVEGFLCTTAGQWKVRLEALAPSCVGNQRGHWYMSFKAFERKTRAEAEAALKGAVDDEAN